ncbi:Uncharacterised protein [Mycobacterium tuberculosis]|nr:Uncharacterised protein [Mycobacterium tuberculosis]
MIRGTTKACTGFTPITFIASISSRMVRDPKSAHIAVEPAPATAMAVTTGPTCVTEASAAPAPERSPAPISTSRMFSTNTMSTVYGIDSMIVGKIETRATNQICSRSSRQAQGPRTAATKASMLRMKNWPSASIGLANDVPFTGAPQATVGRIGSSVPPCFINF